MATYYNSDSGIDWNTTNDVDLDAKTRRRLKREERRAKKALAEAEAKKLGAAPITERLSVFNRKYPNSSELDWAHYPGAGWVHVSENRDFSMFYGQSMTDKKWYKNEELVEVYDFGKVHISEAKEKFFKCLYSENWASGEKMMEVNLDYKKRGLVIKDYIQSEFQRCDFRKEYYPKELIRQVRNSATYARVCSAVVNGKDFTICGSCDRVYEAAVVIPRPEIDRTCCPQCYDQLINTNLIHPHNHAIYPTALFTERACLIMQGGEQVKDSDGFSYYTGRRACKKINDPAIRLFGVEAETEIWRKGAERDGLNRHRLAKLVIDVLGNDFVIIKEDGTLTANEHYSKRTGFAGFEIVTCPADLGIHRLRWPLLLDPRFADAKGNHYFRAWDEYDTCGFHVHVSRDSLTHFQIGRILTFINHKNNAKFIHRVAGRGSDRFCKYIPKEPNDKAHPASDVFYPREKVINSDETDRRNRSRRVAVNLSNSHTIEFRIFRGTMHPRHILRNMEFVDATCDFCNPGDRSLKEFEDYKYFIDYVDHNRRRWPLLAEWMANQKAIAIKKMDEAKANLERITLKPNEAVEVERVKKKTTKENLLISPSMIQEDASF